jgi:hypothetical protein
VTATIPLDISSGSSTRYNAFANVTAHVQAAGAGSYSVANVQAGTGGDRYAGWALVVAYQDPGQPPRDLTIDDGFVTVSSGTAPITIPVSGSGVWTPASTLTSVDFPDPLWPTTATISPECTLSDTSSSALSPGKVLLIRLTRSRRSPLVCFVVSVPIVKATGQWVRRCRAGDNEGLTGVSHLPHNFANRAGRSW